MHSILKHSMVRTITHIILSALSVLLLSNCASSDKKHTPLITSKQQPPPSSAQSYTSNPQELLLLLYANFTNPSGLEIYSFKPPPKNKLLQDAANLYDYLAAQDTKDYYAPMRAVELGIALNDKEFTLRNVERFVQRSSLHNNKNLELEANYYDMLVGIAFLSSTQTINAYLRLKQQKATLDSKFQDILHWTMGYPHSIAEKLNLLHTVYQGTKDTLWINMIIKIGEEHISSHLEIFIQIAQENPQHVAIQQLLASHYLKHNAIEKSVPYLSRLTDLPAAHKTVESSARKLLSSYYNETQHSQKAIEHLLWLKENSPQERNWASYFLAVSLMQSDEEQALTKALAEFQQIHKRNHYFIESQYYIVQILLWQEKHAQALTLVRELDQSYHPENFTNARSPLYSVGLRNDISALLARVYNIQGKTDLALTKLKQRNQQYGGHLESLYFEGMLNIFSQNYTEAEKIFRALLPNHPENTDVLNSLGYILLDNFKKIDEAQPLIEKAHRLSPGQPHIIDSLGWLYFHLKDYDKAIQLLTEALALKNDPDILSHLSLALWENNKKQQANTLIQRGLKDFPNNPKIQTLSKQLKLKKKE